jgi:hypothetical protein
MLKTKDLRALSDSIRMDCALVELASRQSHGRDRARTARRCRARGWDALLAPAAARADGFVVALKRIGILDVAGIPHDLQAGRQLDITRRAAGFLHADTLALVGGGVFGPVLLERILRRGLVGNAGFLVAPENDGAAPGRVAARPDLEPGRPGATTAGVAPRIDVAFLALLRRGIRGLPLFMGNIGGKVIHGRLPMSDRRLPCAPTSRHRGRSTPNALHSELPQTDPAIGSPARDR